VLCDYRRATGSLLEGLSLFPVVPFPYIPQFSLGLWQFSEWDTCFAWHLISERMSACAVTYGSCEGDINWEARVSFHSSACLLLGKGMAFVA